MFRLLEKKWSADLAVELRSLQRRRNEHFQIICFLSTSLILVTMNSCLSRVNVWCDQVTLFWDSSLKADFPAFWHGLTLLCGPLLWGSDRGTIYRDFFSTLQTLAESQAQISNPLPPSNIEFVYLIHLSHKNRFWSYGALRLSQSKTCRKERELAASFFIKFTLPPLIL